jgi:hypothetical protein
MVVQLEDQAVEAELDLRLNYACVIGIQKSREGRYPQEEYVFFRPPMRKHKLTMTAKVFAHIEQYWQKQ